ncbi:MAG TPA: hypothetical protein VG755_26730, partial [Nannocystaceae bacterium]|nr:hypothetical protein [Nannocystaceae bacterium]
EDGRCRAPSGTDESTLGGNTGLSGGGETIADASSQSGSEVGESTASPSSTTPGDTGMTTEATAESSMSTTDVGDSGVEGSACHDCLVASLNAGNDCEMVFLGCAPNRECTMLANCVTATVDADDPAGIPMCCDAHPIGAPAYGDLASCWGSACAMDCEKFALSCGG